ncbi:MAG: cysteine hydrolase [Desulfomonile tiedjei]|nr:cysteine hydrolase [Desulfomonile tiedjei]
MKSALLLIDIQNDYFPGGKMELEQSLEASRAAQRVLAHFRTKELPLIHIQHVSPRPGASFFLPGTPGVEIHESVTPLKGETVFQKNYPNAFRETALLEHLRKQEVSRLVVCGMMTHMCVDSTVRAAFDLGFQCLVLSDACATRSLAYGGVEVSAPRVGAAFIAAMGSMFGKIATVDDFLSQSD